MKKGSTKSEENFKISIYFSKLQICVFVRVCICICPITRESQAYRISTIWHGLIYSNNDTTDDIMPTKSELFSTL